jgi:hypothetical protein
LNKINKNKLSLEYIIDNYQTYKIVLIAVKQDGKALQFVSEEFKNNKDFQNLI